MAERRMFSRRIIESARFLRMPISAQALYFHLGMQADDDGIVESFKVLRMIGANEDDLRVLVGKGFAIILNEDLVTYLPDWTEHNHIRADRRSESPYRELLLQIVPDANLIEKKERSDKRKNENSEPNTTDGQPVDNQWATNGQPMGNQMPQNGRHRLGKDRIGKDRLGQESIVIPSAADEPSQEEKAAYVLPLKGGDQYIVTENDARLLEQLYPGIDVAQEFRSMIGWLNANPARQKTPRGINRFINGWMQRSLGKNTETPKKQEVSKRISVLQDWLEEKEG